MKTIDLRYDPYRLITTLKIDNIDICSENSEYMRFKQFIEAYTPLQTWIERIESKNWNGFLDEICDPERNDTLKITFHGRMIDYKDFRSSLESQNKQRSKATRVTLKFERDIIYNDNQLSRNIDSVVREMQSERFQKIVEQRQSDVLKTNYRNLNDNYNKVKDSEFQVVFAGLYSSGKSTIINALLGHRLLPTSEATCTSKPCKICHNPSYSGIFLLRCLNSADEVLFEETFNNDNALQARFAEISPNDKAITPQEFLDVAAIEIETDLSFLYPKNMSDKLNLVIVDTPGIDSSDSAENGINLHREVTYKAIEDKYKPMIIFCADAKSEASKNIGEYMSHILWQFKMDNCGFNDRYLFVLNKADSVAYKRGETIAQKKKRYAAYLNDNSRWEGESSEEQNVDFVPRIFFTSALVADAIINGAPNYTREEKKEDPEKRTAFSAYSSFRESIEEYEDKNYYLSSGCDIPEYKKAELAKSFDKKLKEDDIEAAIELQCGINVLADAIRDYMERYAYPVKVRELLGTFEAILSDVNEYSKVYNTRLNEWLNRLGETEDKRKGAQKQKQENKEREHLLERLQKILQEQKDKLNAINFDDARSGSIKANFTAKIENNPLVRKLRSDGQFEANSEAELNTIIKETTTRLNEVYRKANETANQKIQILKNDYDSKLKEINQILLKVKQEIVKNHLLRIGSYDFTKNIVWQTTFARMNEYTIDQAQHSYSFHEGRGRFDRIPVLRKIFQNARNKQKDYYTLDYSHFGKEIYNHFKAFDSFLNQLTKDFKTGLQNKKRNTENVISLLGRELDTLAKEIDTLNLDIEKLQSDEVKLTNEIKNRQEDFQWLLELIDCITAVEYQTEQEDNNDQLVL